MTDRSEWPQWLQDAHTEDARVEIIAGVVHWHSGTWRDGDWHGGVWHGGDWCDGTWHSGTWRDGDWHGGVWHGGDWCDGTWYRGTWRDGDWCGGVWHGGTWHDGTWYRGTWLYGTWYGGVWHGGTWHDGESTPSRGPFLVRGCGNIIHVGCKQYTIAQARALCDGGELPDEAPARDSKAGRLLRASVLAQIAFQKALED